MELEDDKKNKNYNKYVIPLALMKQEEMKETMFHWKIVITKSYPFEPPKIFNLDGIHHPEIDQLTGQAKVFLLINHSLINLNLKIYLNFTFW